LHGAKVKDNRFCRFILLSPSFPFNFKIPNSLPLKAFSFCLLLQLCILLAASQSTRTSLNLLSTNTYTTQQTNALSFSVNQAALAYTSTVMAGVYSERRFML